MNWKLAKREYSLCIISIIILSSIASMFLWEGTTKTEGESPLNVISTITGSNQGDYFGWNVSWAGDVNCDGYDDIIVGAPYNDSTTGLKADCGAAYLFFGYPGRSDDVNASNANVTIYGSYTNEHFGWSVACAGNINDDAYDDIIIGAPGFGLNKGRAYVFHGRTSLAWGSVDDAETDANGILVGENKGDKFGCSVSGVGDVSIENHFDDWLYRKKITIQASQVTGDLTDFPVLLNITDQELKKGARLDGFDVVFTASDGKTKLAHEIERYNSSSGELIAWIKIPLLSSTANTDIFMYYGNNESQDQSSSAEVWESNYVGVWHLSENPSDIPPQFRDGTSFDNHGSAHGSFNSDDQVEGKIDGGIDSTGTDEYINVLDSTSLDSLDITGEFTYYAWIYPRDLAWYSIMGNDKIRFCKDDELYVFLYNPGPQSTWTGTAVIKPNEWQQVAATYNRFTQEVILYHNGIQVGTGNVANADLNSSLELHISDSTGWAIREPSTQSVGRRSSQRIGSIGNLL